jgi:hypothetical protein
MERLRVHKKAMETVEKQRGVMDRTGTSLNGPNINIEIVKKEIDVLYEL